jgi:hypothetical protein
MFRRLLAPALALSLASAASAAVNLEASRLESDRETYLATDRAELVLSYRTSGSPSLLRDVRVGVEVRGVTNGKLTFRLREAEVPQTLHEFVMPVDLSRMELSPGTYTLVATIDADDAIRETDEDDNDARTTLVISRSGSGAPLPPATGTTRPPSASQRMRPTTSKTMSVSTCSVLEREWSSPLEAGYHPGFGAATVLLRFDHPVRDLRTGESLARLRLVFDADTVGSDPASALGALEVRARALPARDARCTEASPRRVSASTFRDSASIDLTVVGDDDRLPLECADRLEVVLAYPDRVPSGGGAALLRIDPASVGLEVEVSRR